MAGDHRLSHGLETHRTTEAAAAYFEAEGPHKPVWRNAESSWALAPEVEFAAAEAELRELRENS